MKFTNLLNVDFAVKPVTCTKCGFKNQEDAKYCQQCGAKISIAAKNKYRIFWAAILLQALSLFMVIAGDSRSVLSGFYIADYNYSTHSIDMYPVPGILSCIWIALGIAISRKNGFERKVIHHLVY
jgi:ribosomal protein L40E